MWDLFANFIHTISDWLEALGFIAGAITVFKVFLINRDVKKLKERHLFQVRIDEHIKDLKKSSKKISIYLNTFQNQPRDFKLEISRCIEHCNSIGKKVSENELSNLKPLVSRLKNLKNGRYDQSKDSWVVSIIKGILKKPVSQNEVDNAYAQLNALITEIEHFKNDLTRTI